MVVLPHWSAVKFQRLVHEFSSGGEIKDIVWTAFKLGLFCQCAHAHPYTYHSSRKMETTAKNRKPVSLPGIMSLHNSWYAEKLLVLSIYSNFKEGRKLSSFYESTTPKAMVSAREWLKVKLTGQCLLATLRIYLQAMCNNATYCHLTNIICLAAKQCGDYLCTKSSCL